MEPLVSSSSQGPSLPSEPLSSAGNKKRSLIVLIILAILLIAGLYYYLNFRDTGSKLSQSDAESFIQEALAQQTINLDAQPSAEEIRIIMEKAEEPIKYQQFQLPKIASEVAVDETPVSFNLFRMEHEPISLAKVSFVDGSEGSKASFVYDKNIHQTFQYYKDTVAPNFILRSMRVLPEENAIVLFMDKSNYIFRVVLYPAGDSKTGAVIVIKEPDA